MPSISNILLLCGILLLDNALASPNPAISPAYTKTYNTFQTIAKPTEINSLHDIYGRPSEPLLDVKMTIEQVQKMLESDPTLPRLTRGEIEDLFEQVTKEEYDKSIKIGDYTRAKHMRALMLVLPFNTESLSNDTLQELYNRPPVTKVVPSSEPKPQKVQKTIVPSGKVEIVAIENPNPTTYKPAFRRKVLRKKQLPTTYRPNPEVMKTATTSLPKDAKPFPDLTTPTPFQKVSPEKSNARYSSHYNAKKSDFSKSSLNYKRGTSKYATESSGSWQLENSRGALGTTTITSTTSTTTSKPKITPELEEILESLGFAAKSQSRKRFKLEDPSTIDDAPLPVMSSLIKQDPLSVEEFQPIPINLSADDFRKSLIPQTRADDFVSFKPLPIADDTPKMIKPELENYFKMFGLIPAKENNDERTGRSEKSLKIPSENVTTSSSSGKFQTESIKHNKNLKSATEAISVKRIDTNIDDSVNVDGNQQKNSDEEDYVQLLKLLRNLRELQELNISLTEDRLKELDLNNYNLSETLLSQVGPDPIKDATDSTDPLKNEIKRQNDVLSTGAAVSVNEDNSEPTRFSLQLGLDQNDALEEPPRITSEITATTTTTTTTTTTSAPPSTTTTTVSSARSDNGGNLADSFSGGLDPVSEQPLPQPRRNGLYFLADWNSFLEVGDGDDKVVVRFSPKAGDPSRFIPVNIP